MELVVSRKHFFFIFSDDATRVIRSLYETGQEAQDCDRPVQ